MMSSRAMYIGIAAVIAVIGLSAFVMGRIKPTPTPVPTVATSTPIAPEAPLPLHTVIGYSVEGRTIDAYTYGHGKTLLLFVGGMHGGYEWNSVLLAYKFMDYLDATPDAIPTDLSVTVVPSANPDGVFVVTGKEGRFSALDVPNGTDTSPGRFNAHHVDLNRNFDCNWKPTSMWKNRVVSAGGAAFSEPESQAIRDFVLAKHPVSAVFWHSKSNAVYASACNKGILPQTLDIMNAYARAAKYPAVKSFDSYQVTGDAEGWLASINIPAITVELETHETIEWDRNLLGVRALFSYYGSLGRQ